MNSPFKNIKRNGSSNGNVYPYPRTHTTVMVIPTGNRPVVNNNYRNGEWSSTSSLAEESPTSTINSISNLDNLNGNTSLGFERRRPPLNRAIPPIPESKSNESIMSQASKSIAGTPCEPKQPTLEQVIEEQKPLLEDKEVPVKLEPSVGLSSLPQTQPTLPNGGEISSVQQTATPVTNKPINPVKQISTEHISKRVHINQPPKSPLLSMAHTVRSRLTKFGNRFGRSDSRSPIKSSLSMSSMSKSNIKHDAKIAKSSSMDPSEIDTVKPVAAPSLPPAAPLSPSSSEQPHIRSQITLIPSPSRLPRSPGLRLSVDDEPKSPQRSPVAETSVREPDAKEPNPQIDVSPAKVSSLNQVTSNTDSVYSGKASTSTRAFTSPDWSEAENLNETDLKDVQQKISEPEQSPEKAEKNSTDAAMPSIKNDKSSEKATLSPKKNTEDVPVSSAKSLPLSKEQPPSKTSPEDNTAAANMDKSTKAKNDDDAKTDKSKNEKQRTPKLSAKLGKAFSSSNSKSPKLRKLPRLPSPKVKPKKGSLVLKRTCESGSKIDLSKTQSKSFSLDTKPKSSETRRRVLEPEMNLIKKIERSLIPLMSRSASKSCEKDTSKSSEFKGLSIKSISHKKKRAPLAECESSRVENSPAVELPPIGFDRLTSSPGQRRRSHLAATRGSLDRNGNVVEPPAKPTNGILTETETLEMSDVKITNKGLNASGNCITAVADDFINRNVLSEQNLESQVNRQFTEKKLPECDKAISTPTEANDVISASDNALCKQSDDNAVNCNTSFDAPPVPYLPPPPPATTAYMGIESTTNIAYESEDMNVETLSHENELLRQQLLERDRLIDSLRAQLAATTTAS